MRYVLLLVGVLSLGVTVPTVRSTSTGPLMVARVQEPPWPAPPVLRMPLPARLRGKMPKQQEGQPGEGHRYRKIPLNHFCINHKPRQSQPTAHECHCGFRCTDTGATEDETCQVYCDHEDCACHPEEPCPAPAR